MKIKIEFEVNEKDLSGHGSIANQIDNFIEKRLEIVSSSNPTGGEVYALTGQPIGKWKVS